MNKSNKQYIWIKQNRQLRNRRRSKKVVRIINIVRSTRKRIRYCRPRCNNKSNKAHNYQFDLPSNFSLKTNPEGIMYLIHSLDELLLKNQKILSVKFLMEKICIIDFPAICLLLSKIDQLSKKRIRCYGTFPINQLCKKDIVKSGFLDRMNDLLTGKKYSRNSKDLIVNRGFHKTDNKMASHEIRKAVGHLTGKEDRFMPIYSIIQEICSNSVEHSNQEIEKKNWLFATSYKSSVVSFVLTDVGDGILNTLHRKNISKIKDSITNKGAIDILMNAFNSEYGSSTKDVNRNKGLPKIYETFKDKYIKNLIVVTNNVILKFENIKDSISLKNSLKGTFYYWEIDKQCIETWKKRPLE